MCGQKTLISNQPIMTIAMLMAFPPIPNNSTPTNSPHPALSYLEHILITRSIPKGSAMPALSGQNRPQRSFDYACGDFAPAALASNVSLGLITTRLFG